MDVTVIIPVYNAEEFIEQSIRSALEQPQTQEVILVEDGSTDGSLKVCQKMAELNNKVKLLIHEGNKNLGVSASRNLAIQAAKGKFISFLDADDFYLPNRFRKTDEIFKSHPEADGVYEAIGTQFENEDLYNNWKLLNRSELTTLKKEIPWDSLFEKLLSANDGYFSPVGLTLKTNSIRNKFVFDSSFQIGEDTIFMFQIAAFLKLFPGEIISPIAIRRVHERNRITHHLENKVETYTNLMKMWKKLYNWGAVTLSKEKQIILALRYIERIRKIDYLEITSFSRWIQSRRLMIAISCEYPSLLFHIRFYRLILPSTIFLRKLLVPR